MIAVHDRHKASPESQLEADAAMPQTAYLTMLLSGAAPVQCAVQLKLSYVSCIAHSLIGGLAGHF